MKTIEQLLKPVIAADLRALLYQVVLPTKYTLKMTNDFRFQDKTDTKYVISAVMKTGQGAMAQTEGISAFTSAIQIIFEVDHVYAESFLTILRTYCTATNAHGASVIDDMSDEDTSTSITYEYIFSWMMPTIVSSPYKKTVKSDSKDYNSESIDMVQILLTGSVLHTEGIALNDERLYLYILNGTVPEKYWSETTQAYWDSQAAENKGSGLELPSVTNLTVGYAFRLSDGGLPETYTYYVVNTREIDNYEYVQIIGIQNGFSHALTPMVQSTPLIEERNPQLDVTSDTQVITVKVAVKHTNVLHKWLMAKFYATRTSTSFDAVLRQTRASIGVDISGIDVLIGNLAISKESGFEYMTFTITRR